VIGG
jgi:dynein heavy chain